MTHPKYRSIVIEINELTKITIELQRYFSHESIIYIPVLNCSKTEFSIVGIEALNTGGAPKVLKVIAGDKSFDAVVRIDTPGEADYYRHGGIMQYVLRSLL